MALKYQYIIWDWNGTLLNDASLCRNVMNGLLRRRNLPQMSGHRYREIFDFPVQDYYQRLGFDFSSDTFESLGTEFIIDYEQKRLSCRLQKHARTLLSDLHKRKIKQAILSAYRHDTLHSLLKEKNVHHFFDWIIGADDHYARGKEEQGVRLLKQIDPPLDHTLLIGDTLHDYEVATAMGISSILVRSGHQSAKRLTGSSCPVFNNLREVSQWLMKDN